MANEEHLEILKQRHQEYLQAKARNWRYACHCPHCGGYHDHVVMETDTNGYGWETLQLECADCEGYWELWVHEEELKNIKKGNEDD